MTRPSYFNSVKDRSAKTLTSAVLAKLQVAEQTKRGMAKIAELKQAGKDIRPGKEMLAVVTWGAGYKEGAPRGEEGAMDTGLFFIDCDHLKEDPKEVYYRLLNAKAITAASRTITDGTEYLFTAKDMPREDKPDMPPPSEIKVYVARMVSFSTR